MDLIGTANNGNSVSYVDDYASRLKVPRTPDTGRATNPGNGTAASAQRSGAASFDADTQTGIQLTGSKNQEFRPYDGRILSQKSKVDDSTVSKESVGENGNQYSSQQVSQDSQPAKSPESKDVGSPGVKVDAKQDQSTAVPEEKKKDDPQVQQAIAELRSIEEKVKAHEAAHKAAGGAMTGPVSYSYTRGPDGKNYITGGEVPINVSPGRTPQETISRMQQVIQAALAPADPSPQDRAVAAQAATVAQNASKQKAETESQPVDNKDATGLSGVDSVVKDTGGNISVQNNAGDGNVRVAGNPDVASWIMAANEDLSASGGTLKGYVERMSRQAYSEPAVVGVNRISGNASSIAGDLTPQNITGFGPARSVSFYA